MMLHRHFEKEKINEGITALDDITPKPEFESEVFPPDKVTEEAPRKRGRKKAEAKE